MITIILGTLLAATQPACAQVQTCQWPNKCRKTPIIRQAAVAATCQRPNTCFKRRQKRAAVRVQVAAVPVQTCQWPNRCSR